MAVEIYHMMVLINFNMTFGVVGTTLIETLVVEFLMGRVLQLFHLWLRIKIHCVIKDNCINKEEKVGKRIVRKAARLRLNSKGVVGCLSHWTH